MRLTEEQRALAEQHHDMIYKFLYKYHLNFDEHYDIAAIGFCKGIMHYEPERKTILGSYLFYCMRNEYLKSIRKRSVESYKVISLYHELPHTEGRRPIDIIADSQSTLDSTIEQIGHREIMQNLTKQERFILFHTICGDTQQEIAAKLNLHPKTVQKKLRPVRERLYANLVSQGGLYD